MQRTKESMVLSMSEEAPDGLWNWHTMREVKEWVEIKLKKHMVKVPQTNVKVSNFILNKIAKHSDGDRKLRWYFRFQCKASEILKDQIESN